MVEDMRRDVGAHVTRTLTLPERSNALPLHGHLHNNYQTRDDYNNAR